LCGLLAGCEDRPVEEAPPLHAESPRTEPPPRVEQPPPPFGGEVDSEGRTLRCPDRRFSLTRPWWFVFSDRDSQDLNCPTGTSDSRLITAVAPQEELGSCTVSWRGTLRDSVEHRFAGVGAELAWADLSPYTAITLMTRGDGQEYRLELIDADQTTNDQGCADPDWDFHGTAFRCGVGDDSWRAVTIRLDRLRQGGWGTARPLDLTAVDRLHVRTRSGADGDFACDFFIQSITRRDGDILPLQ
jgi:hypothetical protein